MTFEQLIFAAIAGTLAAGATTGIGVWASRRFGLPGLARQLDSERGELIETLQDRLKLAEADAIEAKNLANATEARRAACQDEIGQLKRDLRATEAELLDLYRKTGERPPRRLTTHERENRG